jgi:hypothetical protein
MVNDLLWLFVAFLALLLVVSIYQIVAMAPGDAAAAPEGPAFTSPVPGRAVAASQPYAAGTGAGAGGRSGAAVAAPRRAAAPAPAFSPAVSRRQRSWGAAFLAVTGIVVTVIGGSLFLSGGAAMACSQHAIAICSQGFVVLTTTQLLGAAVALAGVVLIVAAIALALREGP